jgi:hypothetical protein
MYLLCDTCCVLMLIRLVPDMFTDPKFRCVTVAAAEYVNKNETPFLIN